ncbi:MAG: hypothetical protein JWN25_1703 [Verrucomicrobiales bacterium]|nr:hypothetical protein [Verrucomicrobiales bacterium]
MKLLLRALVILFALNAALASARGASNVSHPPIPIHFTLKEPGFVTLVVDDSEGKRVRNLVSETEFPAGENVFYWDGLDDLGRDTQAASQAVYYIPGKLVAPGNYTVRGLVRPQINLRYQFSVYNEGKPPWHTGDRSSEWLANHTPPFAVLFVPENSAPARPGKPSPGGQMIVGSLVSEGGSGVAWLDLEGHKLHGQLWIGGVWTGASQLARDEGPHPVDGVYAYSGSAWDDELRLYELVRDGSKVAAPRDQRFGTGEDRPVLNPKWKFPKGTKFHDRLPQPGLGGLAVRNGLLVASLPTLNQLLFVDAREHKELGTISVPDPRGVFFDENGNLLVLSGTRLLRYEMETLQQPLGLPAFKEPQTVVNVGLEDPKQITMDPAHRIYISDWGASHQVKVFTNDGKAVRTIGLGGKPMAGPYNPKHMNHPNGITISGDGKLWVAESDVGPKRVSLWSLDGKFIKGFYGPPQYGGGGELDPFDKTLFHFASSYTGFGDLESGMTLKLNWKSRSFEIKDVYYRHDDDPSELPMRSHGSLAPQTPILYKGRTYLTSTFTTAPTGGGELGVLWSLEHGVAVARAAIGSARSWSLLKSNENFRARVPAGVRVEDAIFAWSDINGNGIAEAEEVEARAGKSGSSVKVDRELGMTTATGLRFVPVNFTPKGAPIYDLSHPQILVTNAQSPVSSGGGETVVGKNGWTIFTTAPKPFSAHGVGGVRNGIPMWSYPSLWHGLHASHNAPMPEQPGELIGTTRVIGYPVIPRGSDIGEVWGINGNKGNIYLFTMDGLFLATLFKDGRTKLWDFPTDTPGMLVNEASLHEESFWPFMSQTKTGEIWLSVHDACLVQVEGLEKTRRLPDSMVNVNTEQLAAAREWFVQSEADRQLLRDDKSPLDIPIRVTPITVDGNLSEWQTNIFVTIDNRTIQVGDWGKKKLQVQAAMQVTDGRLFAAFITGDSNLLSNSGESLPLLFKTGGALDLQFDAIPGGERLLVTQVKGRTVAVLYRPKVPGTATEPVDFTSPVRSIKFDRVDDVSAEVILARGTNGNFEMSVPLATLGVKAQAGLRIRGDIGILRGNGSQTMQRTYWRNKSTGMVSDIPSEADLVPRLWGEFLFKAAP